MILCILQDKKINIATYIALAFHASGVIAIGFFHSPLFLALTPLNLSVSASLLIWTQKKVNVSFLLFFVLCYFIGFGAEWVGIQTSLLFGNYAYGNVLGYQWQGVPFIIGIQWFVTIYCTGICITSWLHWLHQQPFLKSIFPTLTAKWSNITVIVGGAFLAVFFDWLLEPVAIHLGYWTWLKGAIPFFNYTSWWMVSTLLLGAFCWFSFSKQNLFAIHLLLIQTMFFLLMRTFG